MSIRIATLLAAALLAGCARQQATTAPVEAAAPLPSPNELAQIRVERFEITPQAVQGNSPVTVKVDLADAPAGTMLTLSWFGPDGWVVAQQVKDLHGDKAVFNTPASEFKEPGRYRASLQAGPVYLARGTVEVTG